MKYTSFKTKATFTFGFHVFFWHYSQMCGLRDDFGANIDPGKEMWLSLVPIYGTMRW
jgi:hypothetical protein